MKEGDKITLCGMEMWFYYEDSGGKVYEYFLKENGVFKQYLYRVKNGANTND